MNELIQIETDFASLSLSSVRARTEAPALSIDSERGHLDVALRRPGTVIKKLWRADANVGEIEDISINVGPKLFEQTDYRLYVSSECGLPISIRHQDPNLCGSLTLERDGQLLFGTINFRSDVGFSKFSVYVDNKPEFDFEVEVYPTKLDYKTDYERLVAETQSYVAGLVFEYLRSTYKLSFPNLPRQSSTVEWLLLLKMILVNLENALHHIAARPIRNLSQDAEMVRAERIRKVANGTRVAINKGTGGGELQALENFSVRQRLHSTKSIQTLDTAEHRWLSFQLHRIRQRLLTLGAAEYSPDSTKRRTNIICELNSLEQSIGRLQKLEPMQVKHGVPIAGFASLQLLSAPGYREAYNACNILSLGLQIEGGPVNLSLKQLSELYEYWCYLTVVHLVAELIGKSVPVESLVTVKRTGIEFQLERGKATEVEFEADNGRIITIGYNRRLASSLLAAQKPDIMISLKDPGWPVVHLLLDAKYRLKTDEGYLKQFHSKGPPIDAVNALHRYRDAILETESAVLGTRPKRTVVQAAALFPLSINDCAAFEQSKLWTSLDKMGIGAIPLLPTNKKYLREWLSKMLAQGGWAVAEQAIGHRSLDRVRQWREASRESVLVGVLRSSNAQEHLDWVTQNRMYYMPLLKDQSRQLSAKWVAIYSPKGIENLSAVTHRARVSEIDIRPRSAIKTPWGTQRLDDGLQVVYKLGEFEQLKKPIKNRTLEGEALRFSTHRWTSRLALERAQVISELFLESEEEWKLYEDLKANQIAFVLRPISSSRINPEIEGWRCLFCFNGGTQVRFTGMHGFLLKSENGPERILPSLQQVLSVLRELNECL